MKLMVVGSDKIFAIENFYFKYLSELGVETKTFNAQSFFFDYYQKGILNKLLFKFGLSGIHRQINILFREAVEKFKPEVIWVFKGMEIFPESLQWAKQKGIKLVSFNPDNPFIFTGKGSGNSNVTESIPLYDLHFTYNREIEQQLREKYQSKIAYLPFGFDVADEVFEKIRKQPEILKVCFLGNPDDQRAKFINSLAEMGVAIDVYGNNWNRFVKHANISVFNPVFEEELWSVLRRYRIQLNLMRIHNEQSHNMRSFEAPGIGAIMLAPDTEEHRSFFNNGNEVFLFSNTKDCFEQIQKILQLSPDEAATIRRNARERSISAGYTYRNRAAFALEVIKGI